ncbi:two-component sensor histidine kinase [Streptomyces durbertensis]|uniref:histidine kinase n=1 Tax=Streptomyces durbertensis TaxID=2448886 RepID=A0ABR6EPI5_9ACTN|nr:histidine kinase [Streptomyces durbertensis]MBB1247033.1 two-component sensor histidine kinase [Streptomyces durbertensis]
MDEMRGGPRPIRSGEGAGWPEHADHRTELMMLTQAWKAFRADLVEPVRELRPIGRYGAGSWLERLPRPVGRAVRRLPQAAVVVVAVWVLGAAFVTRYDAGGGLPALLTAVVVAAPVVVLLTRPLMALWVSLGTMAVVPAMASTGDYYYWHDDAAGMVAHGAVLAVVAWRSRPRTAVFLGMLTGAGACVASVMYPWGAPNPAVVTVLHGLLLLVVAGLRGWRDSRRKVVEQEAVVAEERSRRTLLEERTVIARELHDVVAHHMSVVAIQAEAAPYRVENPPEELVRALGVIRENAVTALTELRRVLGVVRTDAESGDEPEAPQPTLADIGTLLANVRESGREARLVTTGAVRALPPGVELSAYRIVQEALSNVLRHAPGAPACVELSYVLGGLGLRVVNDPSTGPAGPEAVGSGQGLVGMRERTALLGGELAAGETPEGGWAVEAFLPVASQAPDDGLPVPASASASREATTVVMTKAAR